MASSYGVGGNHMMKMTRIASITISTTHRPRRWTHRRRKSSCGRSSATRAPTERASGRSSIRKTSGGRRRSKTSRIRRDSSKRSASLLESERPRSGRQGSSATVKIESAPKSSGERYASTTLFYSVIKLMSHSPSPSEPLYRRYEEKF